MRMLVAIGALFLSASSYAANFECTVTLNDQTPVKIQPMIEDVQTGFYEYIDGHIDAGMIKMSYYPGIQTVVLKVYDKQSDQTYLKNPSPALPGKYNLVVENENGILGNISLKKLSIDCELKP